MSDGIDERFLAELVAEFPRVRVVPKSNDRLSRAIDRFLRVITFGGQSAYMTRYTTVLGYTIYVPTDWHERSAVDRYLVLRHERIHLRQFRRYGRLGMSFLYLVPILPLGLAWGRARIEWEAYRETLRAIAETRGVDAAADPALERYLVAQFVGPAYGFMWPFPSVVRRWIRDEISAIRAGR